MAMIDSNTPILIRGERFVPYLSADRVQARVAELAAALDRDYAGTRPVFVCVLSGAFLFFADLLRRVTLDAEVDFLKLASYRDGSAAPAGCISRRTSRTTSRAVTTSFWWRTSSTPAYLSIS